MWRATFIRKVKRGESPGYRLLRALARFAFSPSAPRIPKFLKPPLRFIYTIRFAMLTPLRVFLQVFYRGPLFQSRCASVGKHLSVATLPWVSGPVDIHIGDNVWLGGGISIEAGHALEQRARLIIKDRVGIGPRVIISVSREIIIEEDVLISFDCRVFDNDNHRREADLRARGVSVDPREILPVRICRHAWIGNGSHIMKGVTIGEGAIIGSNSVVISNIPPYSLAMGNPAEVYFRNVGRPSNKTGRGASRDVS
jgi:acetyltransferase-like isoleucine patch superfamily enzyme